MSNKDKYDKVFVEIFSIEKDSLSGLEYNSIPQWDSVGHMALMAELEGVFEIMMEMDEIIGFNSYKKGIETLNKYNIDF
jgi:acyl carrier protein